jgi:hypothetical protein
MRSAHSASMVPDPSPSRAGSLPQFDCIPGLAWTSGPLSSGSPRPVFLCLPNKMEHATPLVGASLLAMNRSTPRGVRLSALSLATIAGKPAPTGIGASHNCIPGLARTSGPLSNGSPRPVFFCLPNKIEHPTPLVGASLLAMSRRAPQGVRLSALSLATIASRLAPTGFCAYWWVLFNGCQCYLMKATTPCVVAYRYARIRRLVRLGPSR